MENIKNKDLLPVWWAFTWRGAFFGSLFGFILGALAGAILGFLGLIGYVPITSGCLGFIAGMFVSFWAFKTALSLKYSGISIQLNHK